MIVQIKEASINPTRRVTRIRLYWTTKGHAIRPGNEIADHLASEAITTDSPVWDITWPTSLSKTTKLPRSNASCLMEITMGSFNGGSYDALFIRRPSLGIWNDSSKVTQFLTEHTQCTRYLHDRFIIHSPDSDCGSEGTPEHHVKCPETCGYRSLPSRRCESYNDLPALRRNLRDKTVLTELILFLEKYIHLLCLNHVSGDG